MEAIKDVLKYFLGDVVEKEIYQIEGKSVNFIKKRMMSICHWLKTCAAERSIGR